MLELKNINLKFGDKIIFNNFSMVCNPDEITVIKAPSGTGKTSLLEIIMGFNSDFLGDIFYNQIKLDEKSVHNIRKNIAFMPQNVSFIGSDNVLETILAPFKYKFNKHSQPSISKIEEYFELLSLDKSILNNNFNNCSGGEKQRIAFLISILLDREILLLDEPTASLDSASKLCIINLLTGLKNKVIIIASHDEELNLLANHIVGI